MAQAVAVQTNAVEIPFLPEKAVHKVYPNGYQFVFVPKRGEVFNINTWVRTGSIHEDEQNNGVSHFLEHLMFKGTERFKPGEFDKAMEGMGAIINAATWKDFTFYYVTGPKDPKNENFLKALDMHADMLLCSTLPEDEIGLPYDIHNLDPAVIKRERGVVIEEIGMRGDQPWTKIYNALNHMMYPEGHPYQRDVIGTREIISSIPREAIESYYHRWYSADSMVTIVVGDFDLEWLEAEVLKSFDFDKSTHGKDGKQVGESPVAFTDLSAFRPAQKESSITAQVQTSFIMVGYQGPAASDLKESVALDVACYILGEGPSSRMHQTFIEKPDAPVFNAINCGQMTFKLGNVLFIDGNLNASKQDEVNKQKQAILDLIASVYTSEPFTQEEVTRAKKNLKMEFSETSEEASGIAEELGESVVKLGNFDAYTKYLPTLEAITLEDVIAATKKWMAPENHFASSLLPQLN